jgi:hypothetical protein
MRRLTRGVLVALPLPLALALTGCGSDDDGSDVASAARAFRLTTLGRRIADG